MLKKLTLKFGPTAGQAPLEIGATSITVFVGPNNSGKSKLLAELHHYCQDGTGRADDVILRNIDFEPIPSNEIGGVIDSLTLNPTRGKMGEDPESDSYVRPGKGDV